MKKPLFLLLLLFFSLSTQAADFTYDSAGQLLSESHTNGAHVFYKYDDIGNPLQRTILGANAAPAADLAVTTVVTPNPATAGLPVTFTIVITNNGPDAASAVVLTDTFPGDVTANSAASSQGGCVLAGNNLTCNLGTLPNGGAATIIVEATALVAGTINNTATVASPEESTPGNNADVSNTPVNGAVDIAISITRGPNPILNNGSFLATLIVITNNGPSMATGVTVDLPLPPEFIFDFAAASQGTCSNVGGVVGCSLGNLAAQGSINITVGALMSPTLGVFSVTGTVAALETDLDPTNNIADTDTEVIASTLIVTNTNDAGAGSLRQAIIDANALPNADVIRFALPGFAVPTIVLSSDLPTITNSVTIDGFSSDATMVELNGSAVGNGLTIDSSEVTIRSLCINRCGGRGMFIATTTTTDPYSNITVQACLIGTDPAGLIDQGNGNDGIEIFRKVSHALIGGDEFWMGNVISGNNDNGLIVGSLSEFITIAGNHVGTDINSTFAIGNSDLGISFSAKKQSHRRDHTGESKHHFWKWRFWNLRGGERESNLWKLYRDGQHGHNGHSQRNQF